MDIKYLNVIVDKETFLDEHYEHLLDTYNRLLPDMRDLDVRAQKCKAIHSLSCFVAYVAISLLMLLAILHLNAWIFVIPTIVLLSLTLISRNRVNKLNNRVEEIKQLQRYSDLIMYNLESTLGRFGFEEWIEYALNQYATDSISRFLYVFYCTNITKVYTVGDCIRIDYERENSKGSVILDNIIEKDCEVFNSLSLVNHNLILGYNENVVPTAVDYKILQET